MITNRATIAWMGESKLLKDFTACRRMLETVASDLRRGLDLELERSVCAECLIA